VGLTIDLSHDIYYDERLMDILIFVMTSGVRLDFDLVSKCNI
jgi:hypothetical protein